MLYNQHKHVGDGIVVGKNVKIKTIPDTRGRIYFSRRERIHNTDRDFYFDLGRYNKNVTGLSLDDFRRKVEHGKLTAEVRRSFGDVNAWAGDHAKLNPPDGKVRRFDSLEFRLENVANIHDWEYYALAMGNWDHFMPMSYRIWWIFHTEALRLAEQHILTRGKGLGFNKTALGSKRILVFDLDKSDLAKALFLEAYGCHFLQDCFTAGHLRTPRLLFGKDPANGLLSKQMHDEDNARRIEGCAANGRCFRLIGEDSDRDNFKRSAKDPDMKRLLTEVTAAVAVSVGQVLNASFPDPANPTPPRVEEISQRIPRVEIYWNRLSKNRSHTHALEIWPVPGAADTPKPLYKIHARYNRKAKRFEDPILIKRSRRSGWRKAGFSPIDTFKPGKGLSWWIPDHPDKRTTVP